MSAIVVPTPLQTAPATWAIDPADSTVEFTVKTLLTRAFTGRFLALDGVIAFDEADPSAATVTATVAAESVDTGHPRRDAHLRGPDFLDAGRCPLLRFESARVEPLDAARARVHGRLTIRDVTRDATLDVTREGCSADADGQRRARFRATTTVSRRAFGVRWNPLGGLLVGDRVDIALRIAAVRQG